MFDEFVSNPFRIAKYRILQLFDDFFKFGIDFFQVSEGGWEVNWEDLVEFVDDLVTFKKAFS